MKDALKNVLAIIGLLALAAGGYSLWKTAQVAIGVNAAVNDMYEATGNTLATIDAAEVAPQNFIQDAPQSPTAAVTYPAPTPTAYFAPATPTAQFSGQFLADCALAIGQGRRAHPSCPTNAAEMLGEGR